MDSVHVLGAEYRIIFKPYELDREFRENGRAGYCSIYDRQIVICDMGTHPDFRDEPKQVIETLTAESIRHEIVHAFLYESGLWANTHETEAWALNEEVVDWIAIQGPKIYAAWKEAGAVG